MHWLERLRRRTPSFSRSASPASRKRRSNRVRLAVEPLEPRCVLSAAPPADPLLVSSTWFEDLLPGASGAGGGLAADIDGPTAGLAAPADGPLDWIVRFRSQHLTAIDSVAETAGLLAGGVSFSVVRGLGLEGQVLVRTFDAGLSEVESWLGANVHVASFELDHVRLFQQLPNDPQLASLWGLHNTGQSGGVADSDIDAPEAWDLTTGTSSIVVGVIDTGVDYTHPDLAANIWTNPGEIGGNGLDDDGNGFVDDLHGYDFVNNDGDPLDDHSHGTHVAGTIAARSDNGQGVAGVAWQASIMGLKFLSAGGSGSTSNAIRALNYATLMRTQYGVNVRVTNNSWGGGGYSQGLYDAIAASGAAGILFVAAAGNSGTDNDAAPHYPSNYDLPNVVSVAATDRNDQLASFSNYGAQSVDLAAPGVSIVSTIPGGGYASYSGTSMATPHVAGVAALAWSLDPDASVAEVRQALLEGVDPLAGLAGRVTTGGRLNAAGTLALLGDEPSDPPVQPPANLAPTLQSLAGAPASVPAGATLTLTASGAADADGSVAAVSFYHDVNGNGVLDPGDAWLGTDTSIVGGQASLSLGVARFGAGIEQFLARAVDDQGEFSRTAAATVAVNLTDDHGGSAAAATVASMNRTQVGDIQFLADRDWFRFQATAGFTYTLGTTLAGLDDSVLSLYAADGATLLAADDDGGPGLASRITWTATASGTYYAAVTSYDPAETGGYQLSLAESSPFAVSGSVLTVLGTAAPDTFTFTAGTQHVVTLNGVDLQVDPAVIRTIRFVGNGGADRTTLRGLASGRDTATLRPRSGELVGSTYRVEVVGAYRIDVYGDRTDEARLNDSPGDDQFTAYPNRAFLAGTGFLNYAWSFGTVRAYATQGTDTGTLYDSTGNDRYFGYPDRAWMTGTNFYNAGHGFDAMTGVSRGGYDVANLYDSAGVDVFSAFADRASLAGAGFAQHVQGFDTVYAVSSAGGADTAILYDSPGNDTFYGRTNYGYLRGTGFHNQATGFRRIEAHGVNGGVNRFNVSGVSYTFVRVGSWVR
jgi:subtilisin family serine protease